MHAILQLPSIVMPTARIVDLLTDNWILHGAGRSSGVWVLSQCALLCTTHHEQPDLQPDQLGAQAALRLQMSDLAARGPFVLAAALQQDKRALTRNQE